jgi:uncharacterized SAM-binding protein YcdF (DUF218 family)
MGIECMTCRKAALWGTGIAGLALAAWLVTLEGIVLQRMVSDLVLPVGLVWIGLALLTGLAAFRRQKILAVLGLGTWLVHTVSATGYFAQRVNRSLEAPFAGIVPLEQPPFDVVVVLGGGTEVGLNGQSQLSCHGGDRVALAARLFHAGLVKRLVVTGQRHGDLSVQPSDPAQQAVQVLTQLGVPGDRIDRLGGRRTAEEMQQLARHVPRGQRVGLITSAWHMGRALRLARENGMEVQPLPADFRSAPGAGPILVDAVPDAEALWYFSTACREYLARLVGK